MGGRGGTIIEREASMATYTPRDAMYIGSGQSALDAQMTGLAEGTIFQDAKTGRWTKILGGGRRTFISKDEAYKSGAMNDATMAKINQPALGPGTEGSADFITQRGTSGVTDAIPLTGSAGIDLRTAATTGAIDMGVDAGEVASTGLLSGLGELAGGIAGGPIGMIGMMMAPMLLSAMSPLFGKLSGFLGHLFGFGWCVQFIMDFGFIHRSRARVERSPGSPIRALNSLTWLASSPHGTHTKRPVGTTTDL